MVYCAISNCKNSTRNVNRVNGDISYHSFPSDPNIKEKWIDATGNKNWFPNEYSKICSIHFSKDEFRGTNKRRLLSKKAVPTVNILQMISKEGGRQVINQPGTSNETLNSLKKINIQNKLALVKKKLKEKESLIKRLRERNRRKDKKIMGLVKLWERLKNESFITNEQVSSSVNVTN